MSREQERLALQSNLDAQKNQADRNRLGQFATPTKLADDIIEYGLTTLNKKGISFLDPAFGTGSFYSALLRMANIKHIKSACGIEIDDHYALPAKSLWRNDLLELVVNDFTKTIPPASLYNFIICNPPYVRHHHISHEDKQRLKNICIDIHGITPSGLSGLYCYYLMLAHQWMSRQAVAGWLIPSEFMDVNYGKQLKEYLLTKVTLTRIHRFSPNDVQFDDALVSSSVVWFRNELPTTDNIVEFTFGGTHSQPTMTCKVKHSELSSSDKWSGIPLSSSYRHDKSKYVLSDLFSIKRGIATGSNEFFILTRDKIIELGLPLEVFRPILPSPRHLPLNEIEADSKGNPKLQNQLYLLDCDLPEETIKDKYPNLYRYLQAGKIEVASRYLCKSRTTWYKQEKRAPSSLVCTYMGRDRDKKPFRFILNHSNAIAANTYLMLYPKQLISTKLVDNPHLIQDIWVALNDIDACSLVKEGRVYGGGLHKLEPKELAQVSVDNLIGLLELH